MLAEGRGAGAGARGGRPRVRAPGLALSTRSAPPGSTRSCCARRWEPRGCGTPQRSALGSGLSPQSPSARPGLF